MNWTCRGNCFGRPFTNRNCPGNWFRKRYLRQPGTKQEFAMTIQFKRALLYKSWQLRVELQQAVDVSSKQRYHASILPLQQDRELPCIPHNLQGASVMEQHIYCIKTYIPVCGSLHGCTELFADTRHTCRRKLYGCTQKRGNISAGESRMVIHNSELGNILRSSSDIPFARRTSCYS